jgi:hypothetical protein
MVITYLAPPLLLLSGSRQASFIGAAAWAAMTVTYSTMVRYYRLNPAWALALPLAALFYLGALLSFNPSPRILTTVLRRMYIPS